MPKKMMIIIAAILTLLSNCQAKGMSRQQELPGTPWALAEDESFRSIAVDDWGNIYAVGTDILNKYNAEGKILWTKTSGGESVAVDSSGNVYVAGTHNIRAGRAEAFVIKYNARGVRQWTSRKPVGEASSVFNSVAVDSLGNVYAVGRQDGRQNGTVFCNYGSGPIRGTALREDAVIVKYNAKGKTQWARTVTEGDISSRFDSVAVDSLGNVYVAGIQTHQNAYNYGSGSISGPIYGRNAVVVKYNAEGEAQWARTVVDAPMTKETYRDFHGISGDCFFNSIAVDSAGDIYTVGYQVGYAYDYGSGVISGAAKGRDAVIVKYNAQGDTLWARTVTKGFASSAFRAVAADSFGNVYAVGDQMLDGTYNYGSGDIKGAAGFRSDIDTDWNAVIVKYNAEGEAQSARTVITGTNSSGFSSVAVDRSGNIYVAGSQYGNGANNYDNGSEDISNPKEGIPYSRAIIVKYSRNRL